MAFNIESPILQVKSQDCINQDQVMSETREDQDQDKVKTTVEYIGIDFMEQL